MKKILLFGFAFLSAYFAYSQDLIAVEHSGTSTFYSDLPTAVAAAQNGDNIYLPGETFQLTTDLTINTLVHIYGAGYSVDSTLATRKTELQGNYVIYINANGVTIEGVSFIPGVVTNAYITGISFRRCSFQNQLNISHGSVASNILISECIVNATILFTYNVSNVLVEKSIISMYVEDVSSTSNTFNNCIFLHDNGLILSQSSSILAGSFNNCVFIGTPILAGSPTSVSGLQFYNNIFIGNNAYIPTGSDVNNLFSIPTNNLFVNQSGNSYNEHQDYHLKGTCLGVNYGTDGTDVGVYGTALPFKERGVPVNPHIAVKNIQSATDLNGNLPVNIKVAGQQR